MSALCVPAGIMIKKRHACYVCFRLWGHSKLLTIAACISQLGECLLQKTISEFIMFSLYPDTKTIVFRNVPHTRKCLCFSLISVYLVFPFLIRRHAILSLLPPAILGIQLTELLLLMISEPHNLSGFFQEIAFFLLFPYHAGLFNPRTMDDYVGHL